MTQNILTMKNVTKSYPGVVALNDISVEVHRGEVLALVGENGAGKSTLIKTITGAIQPDKGTISFEDKDYSGFNPTLTRDLGIAAIYQEFTLAPSLTVAENIFMGQRLNTGPIINKKLMLEKSQSVLDRFKINIKANTLIRDLTVAYKQLVEIAKAIVKNAKLIIMDEPTAPLTDEEVDILMGIIHELKSEGITIIFISHRLDEVYRVADRVTIMRDGGVVTTKDVHELSKSEMIYHMVGRQLKEKFPERVKSDNSDVALEVKNLTGNGVNPISFTLRRGEILGISGLVGAGRTELVRMIFGADAKEGGEIFVNGESVNIKSPKDAVMHGIGYVSEDRKKDGLLLRMPINKNITLAILKEISRVGLVNVKKETEIVKQQINDLNIRTYSASQLAGNLSGGNQQKVVLGKWLASNSNILILDEPTRGIDVGAKQEIYKLINKLAENGMAIIVITSEMEEMLGLTDRMIILYEGQFMSELKKEDYSQELFLQYASGERSL